MKSNMLLERTYFISLTAILLLLGSIIAVSKLALNEYTDGTVYNEELIKIADEIRYYDEVLTMSANLMALTGDDVWEARYCNYVERLDESIEAAIYLSPGSESYIEEVDFANQRLVEMEKRTFELVREGKQEEAIMLMFGENYAAYKSQYSRGLNLFIDALSMSKQKNEILLKDRMKILGTLVIGLVVVIIAIFLSIIRKIAGRYRIEKLISLTSRSLTDVSQKHFDSNLKWILAELRNKMKADIIVLMRCNGRQIDNAWEEFDGYAILMRDKERLVKELTPVMDENELHLLEYDQTKNKRWKENANPSILSELNIKSYLGTYAVLDNGDQLHVGVISFNNRHLSYLKDDIPLFQSIFQMIVDSINRQIYKNNLYELATIDSLTSINNRRAYLDKLNKAMSQAKRYEQPLSLIMIDLDNFKQINDTYGHQKGDQILVEFSNTTKNCLRNIDEIGRIGGEEFSVFLPYTDTHEAAAAAERIRERTESAEIEDECGEPIRFTVSIGITSMKSTDERIENLLNRADKALYNAKKDGKNQICIND